MITDTIGDTKALVSHAIFRLKSEVWRTMFFTGIFCPLLVFTVPVIGCMQSYMMRCENSAGFKTAEKTSKFWHE